MKKFILLLFLSIFVLTGASCIQQNNQNQEEVLSVEEAKTKAEKVGV